MSHPFKLSNISHMPKISCWESNLPITPPVIHYIHLPPREIPVYEIAFRKKTLNTSIILISGNENHTMNWGMFYFWLLRSSESNVVLYPHSKITPFLLLPSVHFCSIWYCHGISCIYQIESTYFCNLPKAIMYRFIIIVQTRHYKMKENKSN